VSAAPPADGAREHATGQSTAMCPATLRRAPERAGCRIRTRPRGGSSQRKDARVVWPKGHSGRELRCTRTGTGAHGHGPPALEAAHCVAPRSWQHGVPVGRRGQRARAVSAAAGASARAARRGRARRARGRGQQQRQRRRRARAGVASPARPGGGAVGRSSAAGAAAGG
jgi:hypothetical protein